MKSRFAFAAILVCLLGIRSWADAFIPTAGNQFWNINSNWDTNSVPNASGAAAVLPTPTDALTIDLGQPITIGSLTVNKSTTANFNTTLTGSATNTLTFDGGTSTLSNGFSSTATGQTIVSAPVVFGPTMPSSTFTVTQGGSNTLQFTQGLSGTGNLKINRDSNGTGPVVLGAANSYSGTSFFESVTGASNYLVIRLNDANSIPGGLGTTGGLSNITLSRSAILELGSTDFTRGLGTGATQFQFGTTPVSAGFAAFGANRIVNIGGASAPLSWGTAGFGNLSLGVATSTAMVDFQNPIDLGSSARTIRAEDGTAAIDGRISGVISGSGSLTKAGGGVMSLSAANINTGQTIVQGGVLRLDNVSALSSGNLSLGSGGVLGLGAADFARTLGTTAGLIQFTSGSAGFSAHGANRAVVLNGGAGLTWNSGNFVVGSFTLSDDSSDSTIDFQNPINLGSATRTVVAKNGSPVIDAKLSGVISSTGGGLLKDNPGTLELSNVNTYTGTTTVFAGVLLLTNQFSIPGGIAGGNTNNIVFTSTNVNNAGIIGLGQGNFTSGLGTSAGQVNLGTTGGFAAYSADRVVNLGGTSQQVTWATGSFVTSALQLSAVGADAAVDLQNPVDLNAGARTVKVLNGNAAIDGIMSGAISGTGGSLVKDGGGTLKLSAASSYDGGTSIILGRLLVSNTTASGTGSGPVTVTAGTLGGTGSISGLVTVNSGAHIAPGESIESLDVGSLTVNTGSFLDFELGAPGSPGVTSDLINVLDNGGLTLNGGSVTLTNAGGMAPGTYTLIDYAVSFGGSLSNIALGTVPAGFNYSLANNPTNTSIDLQVVLQGDYNGNGAVDAADYVVWRTQDGQSGTGLAADGDANGTVDDLDYDYWRARFGNTAGSGAGSSLAGNQAVPEPATFVMLIVAIPFIWWRRFGWIRI